MRKKKRVGTSRGDPVVWRSIPSNGDHITFAEYARRSFSGEYTKDNGFGMYASETHMVNRKLTTETSRLGVDVRGCTHVVWFKKANLRAAMKRSWK
jgi:hypothetical protein